MTTTAFTSLPLSAATLANLETLGYRDMTPIQAQALPLILKGQDLIAQAKTGSGKTAAFGIGLLEPLTVTLPEFRYRDMTVGGGRRWAETGDVVLVDVPPGDVPSLTAAMARLAGSPALREELAAAGDVVVRERYSIEAMVRGTLAVFESARAYVAASDTPRIHFDSPWDKVLLGQAMSEWGRNLAGIPSFVPVLIRGRIMPNYATIDNDERIPFWRAVGKAVHEHDCKYILQLSHGGRQRDGEQPGDEGADIGDEPHQRREHAPEDRARHADEPEAQPDQGIRRAQRVMKEPPVVIDSREPVAAVGSMVGQ